MISIARIFGAPDSVPAGRHARSASIAPQSSPQRARHRRDDVHHVRVGLDRHQLARPRRVPNSHTRPRSLRPRSTSITCSARSFSSREQLLGHAQVLLGARRARPRAGDRPHLDACRPVTFTQRLGRGARDREVVELEEVHVGRRVHDAQAAVERERLDRAGPAPALRRHDLEDVARRRCTPSRARRRASYSRARHVRLERRQRVGRARSLRLGARAPGVGEQLARALDQRRPPRS